jgi:two-component sensor histidine kinase
VVEANDALHRLHGHDHQELTDPELDSRSRIIRSDGTPFPTDEHQAIVAMRTGKAVRDVEMGVPCSDGKLRWRIVSAQPAYDDRGALTGAVASFFDIIESEQGEEALKASPREGSAAQGDPSPGEEQHAGDLQLVSLQADGTRDGTVREVLKDVTYRARSMVLVHEKLYQSADLAQIDIAEYASSLLSYLWRAHGAAVANFRLTLELSQVQLPLDTAVPCGLILNELAGTLLIMHSGAAARGKVSVSLQSGVDGRIHMSVQDKGIGLPDGFEWREASSLGLRLVQMLNRQLDANMEVKSRDGTRFEIVI